MAANLTFSYSAAADVLCIAKCPTYQGQETEDIDDLVIARRHPHTGAIEYLEILFASKRIVNRDPFRLGICVGKDTINGYPAAAEFGGLAVAGSQWLTLPSAVVAALELDVRPPRFPTYPGDKPADVSRCELAVAVETAAAVPA